MQELVRKVESDFGDSTVTVLQTCQCLNLAKGLKRYRSIINCLIRKRGFILVSYVRF